MENHELCDHLVAKMLEAGASYGDIENAIARKQHSRLQHKWAVVKHADYSEFRCCIQRVVKVYTLDNKLFSDEKLLNRIYTIDSLHDTREAAVNRVLKGVDAYINWVQRIIDFNGSIRQYKAVLRGGDSVGERRLLGRFDGQAWACGDDR